MLAGVQNKTQQCLQTAIKVHESSQWAVWCYGTKRIIIMWSNPYLDGTRYDILEKYSELWGCGEQCENVDLHSKVVIKLF